MATRAFLLCGDEKAVHAVTQILDELEVSFEHSSEPAFSLKRLATQKFDLLIVDCDNAQNATQVFNSARASNQNKNSIAIAIVEGKAGVPNAFRLGASLVLTKPVSLEQVRNTLRTGIGMTRKDGPETKVPAVAAAVTVPAAVSTSALPLVPAVPVAAPAAMVPVAPAVKSIPIAPLNTASPSTSETNAKASVPAPAVTPKPAPVIPRAVTLPAAPVPESKPVVAASEAKTTPASQTGAKALAAAASVAPGKNFDSIFNGAATVEDVTPTKKDSRKQEEEEVKAALGPVGDLAEPKSKLIAEEDLSPEEDLGVPSFGGMAKQPFAGDDKSEKKSGSKGALIAALVVVVLGGAGYGAWQTQPSVRKFVAWEYLNLSSKIASIRGQAPASAPVHPVAQVPVTPPAAVPAPAPANPSTGDMNAGTTNPAASDPAVPGSNPAATAAPSQATNAGPADDTTPKAPVLESAKQDTTSNHAGSNPALVQTSASVPAPSATKSTINDLLEVPEDFSDDQVVRRVHPNYPKQARARKLHGTVVLEAVVNKQGKVDSLQLVSGDPILAQAAADAVKQWRYKPYMHNGEYSDFQTRVTVDFKQP